MKLLKIILFVIIGFSVTNCNSITKKAEQTLPDLEKPPQQHQNFETAYFASGCFWCVEAIFESVKGVQEVYSGYAGGTENNPTYEAVSYGKTSHAEAVEVYYDPKVVSYKTLVKVFFGSHDPTTLNQQGPDRGPQYRSIAFYKNEEEKNIIKDYIRQLNQDKIYQNPIVTEIKPHTLFYKAEEYHQDYEKRHPTNSYIKNVSVPRLKKFQKNYPDLLKNNKH
ncbi:peptide-methionine (S)-S-oxide reductase [Arenibacter nanhaiticus]|uniref:Peptide methionine sulfoxide reductase MsrA n=1 Tax=Arenibacter nanhaiticus TaxID=558155 RepID=A0A1M6BCU0_9FLAO|nr:peptide-methionine (S)-S-oxide reductase MsrA [Arenibacter nanhaiticus]SHI46273.1 peptide-methionine (S)-S-oxide reductase [Arenibacter nanhaiticus]